jgi:hypothetical protein
MRATIQVKLETSTTLKTKDFPNYATYSIKFNISAYVTIPPVMAFYYIIQHWKNTLRGHP